LENYSAFFQITNSRIERITRADGRTSISVVGKALARKTPRVPVLKLMNCMTAEVAGSRIAIF
jgi:hypothetical protein